MLEKRTALQNLFIKRTDDVLAINLFNYRRCSISFDEYKLVCNIEDKIEGKMGLSTEEEQVYNKLKEDCQILDSNLIKELDCRSEQEYIEQVKKLKITHVFFNLTYNCNFHCCYCYQKKYKGLKNIFMTKEQMDAAAVVLDSINDDSNAEITEITISGGESLLPNNIKQIEYIMEKYPGAKFKLFTNGVNILRFWDIVKHFDDIQISLDGDDELISVINGYKQPVFHDIINGIKKCIENNMNISIIAMMTKNSLGKCENFIKEIESSGILNSEKVAMRFSTACNFSDNSILADGIYTKEEYIQVFQYIKRLVAGKKIGVDSIYDLKTLIGILNRDVNIRWKNKIATCDVATSIPIVFSPDGNMYWCSCINPPESAIGKFYPKYEIYNDKLQDLVNRNIFHFEECRKCIFRYVCSSGCPLNAMDKVDNSYPKSCGVFKDEFFMQHLEEIL